MAYEKKNFKDGVVLSAEHLNHMEKGIEDAHNMIGTADISGIGDGTIKGAILALKALIESGGGSSGGVTAEAIQIEVNEKAYYGEDAECEWSEGYFGRAVEYNVIPVYEQLAGCTFDAYFGESHVTFTDPVIQEDPIYAGQYAIFFTKLDGESIDYANCCHLYVRYDQDDWNTRAVYVFFDAVETAFAERYFEFEFDSGTITFPEV